MRQHLKGLTEKASTMVVMRRRTTRKKVPMQPTIVSGQSRRGQEGDTGD
jgi:hypothetical protein